MQQKKKNQQASSAQSEGASVSSKYQATPPAKQNLFKECQQQQQNEEIQHWPKNLSVLQPLPDEIICQERRKQTEEALNEWQQSSQPEQNQIEAVVTSCSKSFNKREKKQLRKLQPQASNQKIGNDVGTQNTLQSAASDIKKVLNFDENQGILTLHSPASLQKQFEKAKPINLDKMLPIIRSKFDEIQGACDYFKILEIKIEELQVDNKVNYPNKTEDKDPNESREIIVLPRGYPQKNMYKQPKIDSETCQVQIDAYLYKGNKLTYKNQKEASQLQVYRNQRRDNPESTQVCNKKLLKKRSNSIEIETLKFADPFDVADKSKNMINKCSLMRNKKQFEGPSTQIQRKIQRKDQLLVPQGLNPEPVQVFESDQKGKYDAQKLEDYLSFCDFYMRDAPVQHGYCGIWLRGSHMYKENAMKLAHYYEYNFDLAKFHILYPMVMSDPDKQYQLIQISKTHPEDLAREVQNAVIDLQGCKQEEIDKVINNFRLDLQNRINDEQLKYHLAILHKLKIQTPPDIEEIIRKSLEFSKEIKKKFNIYGNSQKSALNVQQDKKLKMTELLSLWQEQQTFSYITQEMVILEQQLEKAKQWQQKVESIRNYEVNNKIIGQIYMEGKNIPVNFQELYDEIILRKTQAEDLNNRIQDAIVVKKTRQRVGTEVYKKPKKNGGKQEAANDNEQDKEQQLRDLVDEARALKLQSDQITKLVNKLNEIDKWKQEVLAVFKNQEDENINYKKYRDHYKSLVGRSQVFQIDLLLMKQLLRKCSLIDWRDKVEDIYERLQNGERMSMEQVQTILEEGNEKNFIVKRDKKYIGMDPSSEEYEVLKSLFANFAALNGLSQIFEDAVRYEKDLQKTLDRLKHQNSDSSEEIANQTDMDESQSDQNIGSNKVMQDKIEQSSDNNYIQESQETQQESSLLYMRDLLKLEEQGNQIKVEVEKLKEFKIKIKEIRSAEEYCCRLLKDNTSSAGIFSIKSQDELKDFIKARQAFQNLHIISDQFESFNANMLPYIFWLNRMSRMLKQYCKSLGLKQNQLDLLDPIDEYNGNYNEQNPFLKESDYETLVVLNQKLQSNPEQFGFLSQSPAGKCIKQILEKTNAIRNEFHAQKQLKRQENFDFNSYFKLLENFQSCGLPLEHEDVNQARSELKREKWIKKFNDLQLAGQQSFHVNNIIADTQSLSSNNILNSQSGVMIEQSTVKKAFGQGGAGNGYVRIKQIDVLIKEYQTNTDLKEDESCKKLAEKLINQQTKSQNWLNKFSEMFNSQDQFEPKNGIKQIEELLQEGEELELKLKEFVDLQVHQKETMGWNKVTAQIFNNSKTITLDQLKKHIKDTVDITEGANPKLIELLESLKEIATCWKIFAKTILKIRPIENFQEILKSNARDNEDSIGQSDKKDLFCICRQPENGYSIMICCDFCDMWYHQTCVGLPLDLKCEKMRYKCIGCAIREGKTFDQEFSSSNQKQAHAPKHDFDPEDHGQLAQSPQEMQQLEIENLLLDYFNQKQRISLSQFEYVIDQGMNHIPLKLEEMDELLYFNTQITKWEKNSNNVIQKSQQFLCFSNNFNQMILEISQESIPTQILESEKQEDLEIMNLVIESASFPSINRPVYICLVQLIRYKDWRRECLQTCQNYNQLKLNKRQQNQGKQINQKQVNTKWNNKIILRKDVKKLLNKGEHILNLDLQNDHNPSDAKINQISHNFKKQLNEGIQLVNDALQQLIAKGKSTSYETISRLQ